MQTTCTRNEENGPTLPLIKGNRTTLTVDIFSMKNSRNVSSLLDMINKCQGYDIGSYCAQLQQEGLGNGSEMG